MRQSIHEVARVRENNCNYAIESNSVNTDNIIISVVVVMTLYEHSCECIKKLSRFHVFFLCFLYRFTIILYTLFYFCFFLVSEFFFFHAIADQNYVRQSAPYGKTSKFIMIFCCCLFGHSTTLRCFFLYTYCGAK